MVVTCLTLRDLARADTSLHTGAELTASCSSHSVLPITSPETGTKTVVEVCGKCPRTWTLKETPLRNVSVEGGTPRGTPRTWG